MQAEERSEDCLFPGALFTLLSWGGENIQIRILRRRGRETGKKSGESSVLEAMRRKCFKQTPSPNAAEVNETRTGNWPLEFI